VLRPGAARLPNAAVRAAARTWRPMATAPPHRLLAVARATAPDAAAGAAPGGTPAARSAAHVAAALAGWPSWAEDADKWRADVPEARSLRQRVSSDAGTAQGEFAAPEAAARVHAFCTLAVRTILTERRARWALRLLDISDWLGLAPATVAAYARVGHGFLGFVAAGAVDGSVLAADVASRFPDTLDRHLVAAGVTDRIAVDEEGAGGGAAAALS
jgi:hypothetical protein